MKGGIYQTKYGWQVRFGRKLTKHFKELTDAERFLTGIRFKSDEKTFDIRDYQKDNPLGFENLVEQFLYSKRLLKGVKKYEQRLRFAVDEWGNRNVKSIGYADIDNMLTRLQETRKASKYIKDIRDTVKMFYRWLWQTGEIKYDQIPKFPKVRVSMSFRKVVSQETQEKILEEIRKISWDVNPRIYIGVLFLSTYINVRPSELISIREKDINLDNKRILIRGKYAKTGEPKYIYLIDEDVELLADIGFTFGNLSFFRHTKGRGGNKPNTPFGKGYLYNWWKRACGDLGIEGVDLYGGTRHSSAIELRKKHSPEAVKRATMHKNNNAFERYLQVTGEELRGLYADTRSNTPVINIPLVQDGKKSQ